MQPCNAIPLCYDRESVTDIYVCATHTMSIGGTKCIEGKQEMQRWCDGWHQKIVCNTDNYDSTFSHDVM